MKDLECHIEKNRKQNKENVIFDFNDVKESEDLFSVDTLSSQSNIFQLGESIENFKVKRKELLESDNDDVAYGIRENGVTFFMPNDYLGKLFDVDERGYTNILQMLRRGIELYRNRLDILLYGLLRDK